MMTNLFSIFDPSCSLFSMAWLVLFLSFSTMPLSMWKIRYSMNKVYNKVVNMFLKEVNFTLGKSEKGVFTLIMLIFVFVISLNFLALYPQVFSLTSHLVLTLPFSLTFWFSIILFGWIKNTNHMLVHLVPQGTPVALMMFMVLIEMVSNLIRPVTLCVRLTANLVAGHLLMSLLGGALMSVSGFVSLFGILVPLTLTILEAAVACIQGYVFMTLVTLYVTEIK